jgi:MAP/microtubule affinity-regulating kinase
MWALGVLLFAMLTGTFPFKGISEQDLYFKIQRGNFKIPDGVSKEAKRLIYKLLEVDYRKRMTAYEVIYFFLNFLIVNKRFLDQMFRPPLNIV